MEIKERRRRVMRILQRVWGALTSRELGKEDVAERKLAEAERQLLAQTRGLYGGHLSDDEIVAAWFPGGEIDWDELGDESVDDVLDRLAEL